MTASVCLRKQNKLKAYNDHKVDFSNYYSINSWGSHTYYTVSNFLFIWKIKESLSNCYTYTPLMVASKRHLTLLSNHDQQFCSRLIDRNRKQPKHTKPELKTCFKDYIPWLLLSNHKRPSSNFTTNNNA